MKETTKARTGEPLTVWVPKGTRDRLKRYRLKHGKRSVTHLVVEIFDQWAKDNQAD